MIRALVAAFALVTSGSAAAHNFWLDTDNFTPDAGEDVRVDFKIGDAGDEADDWAVYWERVASLRLFGPDGATDQLTAIRTTDGAETGGAVVSIPSPGTYVLSFESNPSFSDLEAEAFNRYVANERLTAIAEHREATGAAAANGTELYARRAKVLFRVGLESTANVMQPVGQVLEIVPLSDPFETRAGDTIPVQVLWRGRPLEGAALQVIRPFRSPDAEILVTGPDGRADIELEVGSRYLLTTVWGEPAPNDSRADYFTVFASLTFPSPRSPLPPAPPEAP